MILEKESATGRKLVATLVVAMGPGSKLGGGDERHTNDDMIPGILRIIHNSSRLSTLGIKRFPTSVSALQATQVGVGAK